MLVPGAQTNEVQGWGLLRLVASQSWESPAASVGKRAPVSMALGTDPAPWACFDLGIYWHLSACDLLLGCPVYSLGKAEEGIWLVRVGAKWDCNLNMETAVEHEMLWKIWALPPPAGQPKVLGAT